MAYSKIQMAGNGTNGPFTVAFPLGYLSQSDVTCRVNAETDGLGAPLYRTITWLDTELVNISGTAPTALDTITFERTVSKTTLKHDFEDGAPIIEKNLDESHKQALMAAQEALDGRFGALQSDLDMGNHYVKNVLDPIEDDDAATKAYVDLQVFAAGAVPAPTAPDVNKVLTATGVGTYGWTSPVTIPAATESVAGIGEIATDAEVAAGTDNTNKFLNVLTAVTAFARKAVANIFTAAQTISIPSGSTGLTVSTSDAGTTGAQIVLKHDSASPAANDVVGILAVQANDNLGAADTIAQIQVTYTDPTSGSEDATILLRPMRNGTRITAVTVGDGLQAGTPTGGDKGSGTVNATAVYAQGQPVGGARARFSHQTGAGVDGGASVAATWTTSPLNTTDFNNIPGCSLSANQITLAAGTYVVKAAKNMYAAAWSSIRLQNITDGTTVGPVGQCFDPSTAGYIGFAILPDYEFTITSTKVFALQYYTQSAVAAGQGEGTASPAGLNIVWAHVFLEKVA